MFSHFSNKKLCFSLIFALNYQRLHFISTLESLATSQNMHTLQTNISEQYFMSRLYDNTFPKMLLKTFDF